MYKHTGAGSVRSREDRADGLRDSFPHDGLDRLVRADASVDPSSPTRPAAHRSAVDYAYDARGNFLSKPARAATRTAPAAGSRR